MPNDWDKQRSLTRLRNRAHNRRSTRDCAKYTREAIEAGGLRIAGTYHAKDYGPSLTSAGFREISPTSSYQPGDVAVIQAIPGHEDGHMCMFDGRIWISDFEQMHGLYPGPDYRNAKPSYKIYRYP